jgi:hypothetical protein
VPALSPAVLPAGVPYVRRQNNQWLPLLHQHIVSEVRVLLYSFGVQSYNYFCYFAKKIWIFADFSVTLHPIKAK